MGLFFPILRSNLTDSHHGGTERESVPEAGGRLPKQEGRPQRGQAEEHKEPRDVNASFVDKKCPFTGNCSIRGRILTGTITKMKMARTVIIRRDYLHYIKKYNRFEKRHKNMAVHLSPCFRDVKVGDVATVGECRPLSKTVKFNALKITKASGNKKSFTKF